MEAVTVTPNQDMYARAVSFFNDGAPMGSDDVQSSRYRLPHDLARDIARQLATVSLEADAASVGPEGAD